MVLEGLVLVAGLLMAGSVGKRRYEDAQWRAQYPKRGVFAAKKHERMLLSHEPVEKLTILSAFYGEHDVGDWVCQNMDTCEWEFRVSDEIMGCGDTPDDTELQIAWQLDPR